MINCLTTFATCVWLSHALSIQPGSDSPTPKLASQAAVSADAALTSETAIQRARKHLDRILVENTPERTTVERRIALGDKCVLVKDGDEIWVVNFSDAKIELPRSDGTVSGRIAAVQVTLNAQGVVLVTTISTPGVGGGLDSIPSADSFRNQLAGTEEDWFAPVEAPSIGLFEALRIVMARLVEQPVGLAAEPLPVRSVSAEAAIIAYCVQSERAYDKPRNTWSIDFRGIPPHRDPESYGGTRAAHDAFNHLRHVVDADSAKWLYADSVPQPGYAPPPTRRLTKEERSLQWLVDQHRDALERLRKLRESRKNESSKNQEAQP